MLRNAACDKIDVSDAEVFETDTLWGFFERLRKENPVHYCAESEFGPYWSVTRFDDIAASRREDFVVLLDVERVVALKPDHVEASRRLGWMLALDPIPQPGDGNEAAAL